MVCKITSINTNGDIYSIKYQCERCDRKYNSDYEAKRCNCNISFEQTIKDFKNI